MTTAPEHPVMMVRDLLQEGTRRMKEAGCEECALHAELLLCHVLGVSRGALLARRDFHVAASEGDRFRTLVGRRVSREPLQYITGETEFLGLRFIVTPDVLIPRPETEPLVERAAAVLEPQGPDRPPSVLDLGTGSGNIAIGLAVLRPDAVITALDASHAALAVAERNAALHVPGRIRFITGDICGEPDLPAGLDLIVSNPPYISREEFAALPPEIRDHEPMMATTDGADGLAVFQCIARLGRRHLRSGGILLLEMGWGQSRAVRELLAREGYEGIGTFPDLADIERIAEARQP